jgi:hypothetical protein
MSKARRTALLCLAALILALGFAEAQRVTSDIVGTVTDPSGAVVAAARIQVKHVETGATRETITNENGYYHMPGLDPGSYEVRVERDGFKTEVRRGIGVLVDQVVKVDVALEVGEVHQEIFVTGDAPVLETTSGHMSNVVTGSVLRDLPLNGRDLFQLVTLETGVIPSTNAGPNPWADGGIAKVSVQGTRPTMNNITLDGGDINDPAFNVPPGGPSGAQLGVDAVREFRVLLNTYSAEFGRNAGANVQLVTRSGTNQLHASLFEFLRNAAFDAPNYFDVGGIPPFTRNQFGATLGGPIQVNRTFFFLNYEGLLENKGITATTTVLDDNAHLGLLPSASNPNVLVNVGVDPRVAPFLALFPRANGPVLGNGLAVLNTSGRQPTYENYGLIRLDHTLGDAGQLFARYVIDDGSATLPFASTYVPGFAGSRDSRNQYAMVGWQRFLRPSLLNDAKFSFNRTQYLAQIDNSYPLSISLAPNRALGGIDIGGLPLVGNNLFFPFGNASNTFEAIDNVTYEHGRQTLKFGADVKRMQIDGPFDLFVNGEYVFSDLTPFGIPAASNNPALESFLHAQPFLYFGVNPQNDNSDRDYRQTYAGLYLQQDWRLHPRFTLNTGLRWEYSSNPSEANGRLANIRNVATDPAPTVGNIWRSMPLDLWSPRLGFAWSPSAGGKTAVRGGFGLIRDQIWANLYSDTRFYQPYYDALLYMLPQFQAPPSSLASIQGPFPPETIGSFGITYTPKFPYYLEYQLNVQRELARDILLQAAYVGSHGVHLPRTGEANLLPDGKSVNPNFGSLPLIVTDGTSSYNSLQVSLQKRFSTGLSFQGSYTWSKALDDQSGPFPSDWISESGVSQNFFDRNGDYGRASFDRRNVFVFNALYELPFGPGRRWGSQAQGWAGRVIGGWRVGTIASAMSGLPFTANLGSFNNSMTFASMPADRPDLKPGVNPCSSAVTLGRPDGWFNPNIFTLPPAGSYGNAGRNILCGPDLVNFDFSLNKVEELSQGRSVEFRAEFFNIFNHPNFDVPVNTQSANGSGGNGDAVFIGRRATLDDGVTPCTPANDPEELGCGIPAPNAGRIFRTVTTSRQIQFGLKLRF